MLEFTAPQSGDPKQHKSVLAYQVRRHAAKVAAARKRKIKTPEDVAGAEGGAASPLESCLLFNLDSNAEKSHNASTNMVKKTREHTGGKTGQWPRPKWTSVHRLDTSSNRTPQSTPKASPSPASSPSPIDPSMSAIDWLTNLDTTLLLDYANAWPGTGHPGTLLETSLGLTNFPIDPDGVVEEDCGSFPSLLTMGKHIPDTQASLLASEMGSGFRDLGALPRLLRQAHKRAVGATVALDQYERKSFGAALLEDIVEEAELCQRGFQAVGNMCATSTGWSLLIDCCRLTGLIYCELVLFPSLKDEDFLSGLISELAMTMETFDFWHLEDDMVAAVSDMLLWATVLGAVAEDTLTGSRWFVRRLATLLFGNPRLWDWSFVRTFLCKFLWWQPVCDQAGRKIWVEALKLGK